MRTIVTMLSLSLSLLAASALADGIYKWVDENGVVHFGSQPPQKEQVEVVKAPKSERYKKWHEEQQALVAQKKMATAAEAQSNKASAEGAPQGQQDNRPSEAEMAARAQRCRSAQQRLQELESHARVREVDASGSYRVLPEEERQQRIQQTRQILQSNC
ncbi:DUF4124 domain-containing protein [Microbulbifer hydrolyticus]|uniref:DUF4124 domain-containing protein n=1 Tax=Microbulbifer hydrolyticus TaxID=48074 RepID=A0A6P1T8Z6_9GAMM|nr:DUF4124 domain-containing protein [Microbulbifer hydrolyticus]MBB5210901.1 hypothetical protein [Microbulbifer hydrolyticus]QHQ38281.1 DUF4124 domain-containing protein [Microbulbifer hydrolyticus]